MNHEIQLNENLAAEIIKPQYKPIVIFVQRDMPAYPTLNTLASLSEADL
jgi:hypothetical protein